MIDMVFPTIDIWEALIRFLTTNQELETAAVALAKISRGAEHRRFIVKKLILPGDDELIRRTAGSVSLSAEFMEKVYAECIENNLHPIDTHTHPFARKDVSFSPVDDRVQKERLGPYVSRWFRCMELAFLVLGENAGSVDARAWNRDREDVEPIDKIKILDRDGIRVVIPVSSRNGSSFDAGMNARTVLAVGTEAQKTLSTLSFAIVGVGGLGSLVAEQLSRLGVRKITIVDDDRVSESNRNRLIGSTKGDVRTRTKKVTLIRRSCKKANPDSTIACLGGDFLTQHVQERCKDADVLIGCVDNVGARLAMNRFALSHAMPYFDLGCGGRAENNSLVSARGQIIKVVPGSGFCLHCGELFKKHKARLDLMSRREREAQSHEGYIDGADLPQASVYAWNMVTAGQAVWQIMRYISGDFVRWDGVAIDLLRPSTSFWREDIDDKGQAKKPSACHTCGTNGYWGCGDEVPYLLRQSDQPVGNLPAPESEIGGCSYRAIPERFHQPSGAGESNFELKPSELLAPRRRFREIIEGLHLREGAEKGDDQGSESCSDGSMVRGASAEEQ